MLIRMLGRQRFRAVLLFALSVGVVIAHASSTDAATTTLLMKRTSNAAKWKLEVRERDDIVLLETPFTEPLALTLTKGNTYSVLATRQGSPATRLFVPTALIDDDTIRVQFDERQVTVSHDVVNAFTKLCCMYARGAAGYFSRIRPLAELPQSLDSVLDLMNRDVIDEGERYWTQRELMYIRDSVRNPVIKMVTVLQKRIRVFAEYATTHPEGSAEGLKAALNNARCDEIALLDANSRSHGAYFISSGVVSWILQVMERTLLGFGRALELGPATPKDELEKVWKERISLRQFDMLQVLLGKDCRCQLAQLAIGLPSIEASCSNEGSIARTMARDNPGEFCIRTLERLQELCDAEFMKGQNLSSVRGITPDGTRSTIELHPDSIYLLHVWTVPSEASEIRREMITHISRMLRDANVTVIHLNLSDIESMETWKSAPRFGPGPTLFAESGYSPTVPILSRSLPAFILVGKNNIIAERIWVENTIVEKVLALKRKGS